MSERNKFQVVETDDMGVFIYTHHKSNFSTIEHFLSIDRALEYAGKDWLDARLALLATQGVAIGTIILTISMLISHSKDNIFGILSLATVSVLSESAAIKNSLKMKNSAEKVTAIKDVISSR